MWQGGGLHAFDRKSPDDVAYEQHQNAVLGQIAAGDRLCRHH